MNKVEGHQNLYKDMDSGVIVNRGTGDRQRYQTSKLQARENIDSRKELTEMRKEMDEIKDLLKILTSKIVS